MITSYIKPALLIAAFALPLTTSGLAGADAAPPVMFHSISQEGQDVKIVLEQPEDDWHANGTRTLSRVVDDTETELYNFVLDDETPFEEGKTCGSFLYEYIETAEFCATYPESCHECDDDESTVCVGESCDVCTELEGYLTPLDVGDYDFCDLFPDYYVDCDGDGTAECCLTCADYYLYEFWDRCVPAGDAAYQVTYIYSAGYTEIEDYEELTIAESGESCDAPSTDEPTDTEDTEDSDDVLSTDDPTDTEDTENAVSSDEPEDSENSGTPAAAAKTDNGCGVVGVGHKSNLSAVLCLLHFR